MPESPSLTLHTREWRQTRAHELSDSQRKRATPRQILAPLELREETRTENPETGETATIRTLRSYASLFNTPYTIGSSGYRYEESVPEGAFKRSLAQNPDVVFRYNHTGPPLARSTNFQGKSPTLRLGEDERGLWYEADLDLSDPDVQALIPKIERGDLAESSFAFRCTRDTWNEDCSTRALNECNLDRGDVSIVTFGASRATGRHMLLRSEEALAALQEIGAERFVAAWAEWRDYTLLPLEERVGKTLSAASTAILQRVLELLGDADVALDQAQPLLADLLGVPNPDAHEGAPPTKAGKSSEQLDHVRSEDPEERGTESPLTADHVRSIPHLLDTVLNDLAHARQHAQRLFDGDVLASADGQQFNAEHLSHHLDSAQEHALKLDSHLSEHPSDPEVHRSERERITAQREEESPAETRDAPTYEDYDVMNGLKQAKLCLAAVKACQLADPDYQTDPDDKAVMGSIEAAEAAVDQAIITQSKDGRRDPGEENAENAETEERADEPEEAAGAAESDAEVPGDADVREAAPDAEETGDEPAAAEEPATRDEGEETAVPEATDPPPEARAEVVLGENDSDELSFELARLGLGSL